MGFAPGRAGDVTAGETIGGSWHGCRDALGAAAFSPSSQMKKEGVFLYPLKWCRFDIRRIKTTSF